MRIISCSPFQSSTVDQDVTLSTQTEDPMIAQLKKDAQIECIDPAIQEVCFILTSTIIGFDALSPEGCCQ